MEKNVNLGPCLYVLGGVGLLDAMLRLSVALPIPIRPAYVIIISKGAVVRYGVYAE